MRRVPIVPTIIVLIAVGVMIRLGFWQLDRLHQKEAMLARYAAAAASLDLSFLSPDIPEALYRKVNVYCEEPTNWSARAGRNNQGEAGWAHTVRCTFGGMRPGTPKELQMPDYVLRPVDVVLGWSKQPTEVQWQGGEVAGTVTPSGELGYTIVADPPLAGLQPNARPDPNDVPNNHLSYAVQWFFFAGVALVIYALALRKRWRER